MSTTRFIGCFVDGQIDISVSFVFISIFINHILGWSRIEVAERRYTLIINSLTKSNGNGDNKIMVENNWLLKRIHKFLMSSSCTHSHPRRFALSLSFAMRVLVRAVHMVVLVYSENVNEHHIVTLKACQISDKYILSRNHNRNFINVYHKKTTVDFTNYIEQQNIFSYNNTIRTPRCWHCAIDEGARQ